MSVSALLIMPRRSRPLQVADVGTTAPNFELADVTGRPVALADFRGQAIVLFFSSLSSAQSTQYEDRVLNLARDYESDGRVKVVAINVGERPDPYALRFDDNLAHRTYPTLVDDKAYVAGRYSITDTPTMVVVDSHGVVRYRGPFDNSANAAFASRSFLASALQEVLESTTVAVASK